MADSRPLVFVLSPQESIQTRQDLLAPMDARMLPEATQRLC